jgi:hypothetical protein
MISLMKFGDRQSRKSFNQANQGSDNILAHKWGERQIKIPNRTHPLAPSLAPCYRGGIKLVF